MRKNCFKKLTAVCLTTVSMFAFSIPAFAKSDSMDFGYTTVWYSATARDYYAGIEMETDTECDMSCYGNVSYENVYGDSGRRSLSGANGWGYNCSASMRSGTTTYWNLNASYKASNDFGNSFYDELNGVSE